MLWLGFLINFYRYKKVEILVKSGKIFKTDLSHFLILRLKLENISSGVLK